MISVSGIPGSGKSTLAKALSDALSWPVIRFDDYEILTTMHPSAVAEWLDRGAPLSDSLAPGFCQAALSAGPNAILDTPFGPLWPGHEKVISFSVWIDCPFDIALARKLQALAWAGRSDPDFATWMQGWLQNYPHTTRPAYEQISRKTQRLVNCSVDGASPWRVNYMLIRTELRKAKLI